MRSSESMPAALPSASDPPFPDHPLFSWEMQWGPAASPHASLDQYTLTPKEKKRLAARKKRGFGFSQALRKDGV